ncbi:hypothetical protein SK128_010512 [Halocaridina rubra]|uniref:Uncharacterized protein n=1 Tax=Halocaridina rubra TaxID=373956 RepID=A0AAN9AAT6_HALRR
MARTHFFIISSVLGAVLFLLLLFTCHIKVTYTYNLTPTSAAVKTRNIAQIKTSKLHVRMHTSSLPFQELHRDHLYIYKSQPPQTLAKACRYRYKSFQEYWLNYIAHWQSPKTANPASMSMLPMSLSSFPEASQMPYHLDASKTINVVNTKYNDTFMSSSDTLLSLLSRSFTPTQNPCTFLPSSLLSLQKSTKISSGPCLLNWYSSSELHEYIKLSSSSKQDNSPSNNTAAYLKEGYSVWKRISHICKSFNNSMPFLDIYSYVKPSQIHKSQRLRSIMSNLKDTCAFLSPASDISLSKCVNIKKICKLSSKQLLNLTHEREHCDKYSVPMNFHYKTRLSTDERINLTCKNASPSNEIYITNAMASKHVYEFQTAFVKSHPYFLTDVRTEQSLNCRLCQTKIYQEIREREILQAILSTPVDLHFPEPRTRSIISVTIINSEANETADQICSVAITDAIEDGEQNLCSMKTSERKESVNEILITPTIPPDVVPVPSTKSKIYSTDVPHGLNYEVMLEDAIYSRTDMRYEMSQSLSPTWFSEWETLYPYVPPSLSLEYIPPKPVILESSIRSFPDVVITSTDI